MERQLASSTRRLKPSVASMLPAIYALLVATFFVVRYRGSWVEQDTIQLMAISENMYEAGALQPEGKLYPYGFGYSALLTFLSNVSGLTPESFQTLVGPFALVLTAICAFVLYRQLTGSVRLGALAATLLCMQPELVFVTLRGSHERFTWAVIMLTVLLLAKSFGYVGRWRPFVACILCGYLTTFALISLNVFFASSFVITLALSLAGGWLLVINRLNEQEYFERNLRRVLYVVGSSTVLIYLFIFYLYSPAGQVFRLLDTTLDKLGTLLLNLDPQGAAAPYANVLASWSSPQIYLVLTAASWAILLISLAAWVRLGYRSFLRRERLSLDHLLLWLFYGAFAGQIAASILTDRFGLLSTNLQVRLFPAVMLFAIPLALIELRRFRPPGWFRRHPRPVLSLAVLMLALWLSGTSLLKATLDPVVSNKWLWFSATEHEAVNWLENRVEHASIWCGYDERLRLLAYSCWGTELSSGNYYDILDIEPYTRYVFLSDLVRQHTVRIRQHLPSVLDAHRIYDSGSLEIYQHRPTTPYQS